MGFMLLIKSIITGFVLSVPIGPVNLICIRRSLADGRQTGFIAGLGAATADAFYAYVAGIGLSFVTGFLQREKTLVAVIGGMFLCYLGIRTFKKIPREECSFGLRRGFLPTYISTFLLSIANPVTIIAFTAAFAGFGLAAHRANPFFSFILVIGVFMGAALWWYVLSRVVSKFSRKFNHRGISMINRISGAIITAVGIITLLRLV